jgi:hypothetical protein
MNRKNHFATSPGKSAALLFLVIFANTPPVINAATVWNGPTMVFAKTPFADWTKEANQDRITPNVWITRANSQGPFNAETESGFAHFLSPADTAWASGQLADYATLTYADWNTWCAHFPPGTIGQNAVVHLITDDIYLSLKFTFWSEAASGGGFSYERSTPGSGPPPPPPAPIITGAAISVDGSFHFAFTNMPGNTFTILATTNVTLPLTNWTVLGTASEFPAASGHYQFVDPGASTNSNQRHYIVRSP